MISNIGESICHFSCIHSEGKAIEPNNLKLVAKYTLRATLKIGWQAPGGNVGLGRVGAPPKWTSLQEDTGRESIVPWASTVRGQEDCLVREENQIPEEFLTASEDRKKIILQTISNFLPPGDKRLHTGPQFAQTCDDLHTWRWLFCRSEHQQKYKHSGPQTEQNCEILPGRAG